MKQNRNDNTKKLCFLINSIISSFKYFIENKLELATILSIS